jgi:hypothetical protein
MAFYLFILVTVVMEASSSQSSVDPVALLVQHANMYGLDPPLYIHLNSPPYWQCRYMGNITGAPGTLESDGQATVARLMLILATVNRPLPADIPQ